MTIQTKPMEMMIIITKSARLKRKMFRVRMKRQIKLTAIYYSKS